MFIIKLNELTMPLKNIWLKKCITSYSSEKEGHIIFGFSIPHRAWCRAAVKAESQHAALGLKGVKGSRCRGTPGSKHQSRLPAERH